LSDSRIDPVLNLIRNLVISIEDGSVSAEEACSIFEALAAVLETLSLGVDRWYLRWTMRAGAAALREAGEHVTELPGWRGSE
tara:strand:+ start:428 stop:673 length:246 start_codon:yes stop_codon:yes gene_type:complete